MRDRVDGVAGWLLLAFAVVVERLLAGRRAYARWLSRRDAAVRAARRRGVSVEVLAARLGWSQGWVRQVLAGKRPPEVEEAA